MDLRGGDEVDGQVPTVQDAEDVHQEAVCTGALVAVDVENHDVVLDRDSGGTLRSIEGA